MPDRAKATRQTSGMADFHVYRDRLEIRLTRAEKVLALRRDDIVVPRDSIRSVAITEDPWIWIRGVRAPGNSIPLTLAVGTWKFHGGKDFLVLKGKQRSAVVIDIDQPDAGGSDKPVPQTAIAGNVPSAPAAVAHDVAAGGSDATPGALADLPSSDEVAEGFSRVIVSTQHASQLVEALRDIHPGSDGPTDEVIS